MKIQVMAIFFHICYSFGHQSCFENGKDYPGSDIYQNGFWTSTADQCQELCQNNDSCEFWTWLLDYDGKDGLCYMKYSKGQVVNENKAISGPKYCLSTTSITPITSITTMTPATTTTTTIYPWKPWPDEGSTFIPIWIIIAIVVSAVCLVCWGIVIILYIQLYRKKRVG